MAKAQPKSAADALPTDQVAGQQEQQQSTDTAAPASETQALATAGAEEAQAQSSPPAVPDPTPAEVESCAVRVLAAVTIGHVRYKPNTLIEGMPLALAKAHAGSVDPHPDAVAYARSIGSPVEHFGE